MIIAVSVVKNEEDIIEKNIRYHLKNGVDHFFIIDNASTDDTREIAESFNNTTVLSTTDTTHSQWKSMVIGVEKAIELKPDYIICVDADEFWTNLRSLEYEDFNRLHTQSIFNHLPIRNDLFFPYYHETIQFPNITAPKAIFKPVGNPKVTMGNHFVIFIDDPFEIDKFGIPTIPLNERGKYTRESKVVVHHYPIRSYNQFKNKIINGYESVMRQGNGVAHCNHWKELYHTENLQHTYDEWVRQSQSMIYNAQIWTPNFDVEDI